MTDSYSTNLVEDIAEKSKVLPLMISNPTKSFLQVNGITTNIEYDGTYPSYSISDDGFCVINDINTGILSDGEIVIGHIDVYEHDCNKIDFSTDDNYVDFSDAGIDINDYSHFYFPDKDFYGINELEEYVNKIKYTLASLVKICDLNGTEYEFIFLDDLIEYIREFLKTNEVTIDNPFILTIEISGKRSTKKFIKNNDLEIFLILLDKMKYEKLYYDFNEELFGEKIVELQELLHRFDQGDIDKVGAIFRYKNNTKYDKTFVEQINKMTTGNNE